MNIIPKPTDIKLSEGSFTINNTTGINCDFKNITENLNGFLLLTAGYALNKGDGIKLKTVSGFESEESYKLTVSPSCITVEGAEKGLFYGVQSLKQLVVEYLGDGIIKIPCCVIYDTPRYIHRGFMLDCCRHYFELDFVKKMIDLCSLQKLNIFHWHLTEDQGWRVQIDKYPLLTEIGSIRKESRGDGLPVKGFYTKSDIKEAVAYAKERYIDVIPEFDIPGHTMAAIAAYPCLSCEGAPVEVATTFGIKPTIMCGGKESTYEFVENVIKEMAELFPYKYFHIGGDEAIKTKWRECPECQKKMRENGLENEEQLQAYFTDKVVTMLKSFGKTAICWNESVNSGILNPDCLMQYWKDGNHAERVKAEINNGRKAIMSKFTPLYLDYPHGMHPLRCVYRYNPVLKGLKEEAKTNIIGVESPLWSEYVPNPEKAEQMVFPRLLALADTAWSGNYGKNFREFKNRLKVFHKLLDVYDVNYTPISKSNPDRISGTIITIKHFLSIIDKELIKTSKEASKETSKAEKAHKTKEQK